MKHRLVLWTLVLLIPAALLGCSFCGAARLGWDELWQSEIFWHLRLPRQLLALLVGASLAVCGATYQAVFRNPLTDPYLLGVSSGASLGAAIAILLGLESYLYGIGGCALATALLTVVLIYRLASRGNHLNITTLLLTGVCLTLLISAAVSFLMVMHNDKMDRIIFWTMGSFASASWLDLALLTPITLAGLAVVLFHARNLNLLLTGSDNAQSMGVNVARVQTLLLATTTIMVAFAVASCGVIGFVGLIVPHAVRLVIGADNRRLLPIAALAGALFMLLCDTLARTLFQPSELPVGSLTALIGAPLFIYLLCRNKKTH